MERDPCRATRFLLKTTTTMKTQDILIRETNAGDLGDILEVETLAFGYDKEAKLTAELLADTTAGPLLSLLAFHDGRAVGHILFTRAHLKGHPEQPLMHILAPLAVRPEFQNMGIGGQLIKEGLRLLRERGSKLVFVLGHKDYYPRHGFLPDAGAAGFPAPYPIPEEFADYWMVLPLTDDGIDIRGQVGCCEVLSRPEHWRDDEGDR